MRAFNNVLNQQSITNNSNNDKFLAEVHNEASCIKKYEQINKKLESSSINYLESRKSLIQTTTNSIDNQVVRLAKEFFDKLLPNGIALSDDEVLEKLNNELKSDPNLEK